MLSSLYQTGVRLRHALYDRNWLRARRVHARVVSVGNIVCGGSGKTPLVKLLTRDLVKTEKVAILTRGYRSVAEKSPGGVVIRSDALLDPSICGDEPFLLAQALPNVSVYVGRDRVASAERAVKEGFNLLLLDDGMQHRRLARDIELAVLDGKDLWGGGRFLPFGRLRDLPKRLACADALFVNHVSSEEHYGEVERALAPYSSAPVIGMGYALQAKEPCKVGLFCALGSPQRFVESVRSSGYEVVAGQFALDHSHFDLKQLKNFSKRAAKEGAVKLVCSEKDAIKLPKALSLSLPLEVITAELHIRFGTTHFETLMRRMRS